ncbi:hypothetical protein BRADI_5g03661v3 [Brachypodium distachyon]|uniref:Uncharacterized protein n=1 Tax=Brachypodium distachyon TaxID=15368 RepID=A0A0Q3H1I6_BRADI|nr:hypothetical protein BRADI_5g03661v3 [Brachypodium distachyon]
MQKRRAGADRKQELAAGLTPLSLSLAASSSSPSPAGAAACAAASCRRPCPPAASCTPASPADSGPRRRRTARPAVSVASRRRHRGPPARPAISVEPLLRLCPPSKAAVPATAVPRASSPRPSCIDATSRAAPRDLAPPQPRASRIVTLSASLSRTSGRSANSRQCSRRPCKRALEASWGALKEGEGSYLNSMMPVN